MAPRAIARLVLIALYLGIGLVHVLRTDAMLPIMPAWIPWPREVILLTGVCELAGAVGLAIPRLRKAAGVMLAIYAVCVFPANIHHAFDHVTVPGLPSSWWYHGPRLLFQPVLVWLPLWATEIIDWPFGTKTRGSAT